MKKFLPNFINHSVSDAEIILIDNFSHDNSIKFVESQYPEITIIKLDKNHGFAGGYNQGLKKLSHKYFLIVNSDIEVSKNWIKPLIDLLKSDSNISVVQPKILNYNKKLLRNKFKISQDTHIFLCVLKFCVRHRQ